MTVVDINDVQPRAQAALTNSPFYELRELLVDWHQDAIRLSGRVTSFYHKQLAQEVIRSVCKDTKLINAVCVEQQEEESLP